MAKLKDRRAAHRLVAEVLWTVFHKEPNDVAPVCSPEVRAEVEKIRETHFAIGAIVDGEGDFEVLEPGALAMGGVYRCDGCSVELTDKTKRLCSTCEAKVDAEQKNGTVA